MIKLLKLFVEIDQKINHFLDKIFCFFYYRKLKKLPTHVGIIPDGVRRYIRKKSHFFFKKIPEEEMYKLSYTYGAENLKEILKMLFEIGVQNITVYCLSYDNFTKRPKFLVEHLLNLIKEYIKNFREFNVKIIPFGELHLLPKDIQKKLDDIKKRTNKYDRELCLLIAYDYKKKPERNKEIDLLIRSGKEKRISGFLPLDVAYSELYFIDKYWPEVGKRDILKALAWYSKRDRRFGK